MDTDHKMWAIDHGVSWHQESKIRTVLWGWIDIAFNDEDITLLEKAKNVLQAWKEEEFNYLSEIEIEQSIQRVDELLEIKAFPQPGDQWPAVPWPIF
jgi:hypothetical protein